MELSFSYDLRCLPLCLFYFLPALLSIPNSYPLNYGIPFNLSVISYHVASVVCLFHKMNTRFFLFSFFFLLRVVTRSSILSFGTNHFSLRFSFSALFFLYTPR